MFWSEYRISFIRSIVRRYEKRRQQLGIAVEPSFVECPLVTIRGPVTWKCNFQLARNRIDQVLMVNHPVLQAINYLWHQLWVNLVRAVAESTPLATNVLDTSQLWCDWQIRWLHHLRYGQMLLRSSAATFWRAHRHGAQLLCGRQRRKWISRINSLNRGECAPYKAHGLRKDSNFWTEKKKQNWC